MEFALSENFQAPLKSLAKIPEKQFFLQVLGLNTPAHQGGLQEGDVLVNVQHELVTLMTHPQVVSLIKAVKGDTLEMRVERGDHVVPNMQECFPVKSEQDIVKVMSKNL